MVTLKKGNRSFTHVVRAASKAARRDTPSLQEFFTSCAGSMLPDRALITGALRQVARG